MYMYMYMYMYILRKCICICMQPPGLGSHLASQPERAQPVHVKYTLQPAIASQSTASACQVHTAASNSQRASHSQPPNQPAATANHQAT